MKFVFTAAFTIPSLLTVVTRTAGHTTKFLLLYQFLACSPDNASGACKGSEIFSAIEYQQPPSKTQQEAISSFGDIRDRGICETIKADALKDICKGKNLQVKHRKHDMIDAILEGNYSIIEETAVLIDRI